MIVNRALVNDMRKIFQYFRGKVVSFEPETIENRIPAVKGGKSWLMRRHCDRNLRLIIPSGPPMYSLSARVPGALTAAITAAELGLEVLVIEKGHLWGGTSATSGGTPVDSLYPAHGPSRRRGLARRSIRIPKCADRR